jgi:hypothetical protein
MGTFSGEDIASAGPGWTTWRADEGRSKGHFPDSEHCPVLPVRTREMAKKIDFKMEILCGTSEF